jgi:hypothetical protein
MQIVHPLAFLWLTLFVSPMMVPAIYFLLVVCDSLLNHLINFLKHSHLEFNIMKTFEKSTSKFKEFKEI